MISSALKWWRLRRHRYLVRERAKVAATVMFYLDVPDRELANDMLRAYGQCRDAILHEEARWPQYFPVTMFNLTSPTTAVQ